MQFVQPILHNLKGTESLLFGICGRAVDGTQQIAFLAVLSRAAKRYVVSDNAQRAATKARQRFASQLSLIGCESRELLAKDVPRHDFASAFPLGCLVTMPSYSASLCKYLKTA